MTASNGDLANSDIEQKLPPYGANKFTIAVFFDAYPNHVLAIDPGYGDPVPVTGSIFNLWVTAYGLTALKVAI